MSERDRSIITGTGWTVSSVARLAGRSRQTLNKGVERANHQLSAEDLAAVYAKVRNGAPGNVRQLPAGEVEAARFREVVRGHFVDTPLGDALCELFGGRSGERPYASVFTEDEVWIFSANPPEKSDPALVAAIVRALGEALQRRVTYFVARAYDAHRVGHFVRAACGRDAVNAGVGVRVGFVECNAVAMMPTVALVNPNTAPCGLLLLADRRTLAPLEADAVEGIHLAVHEAGLAYGTLGPVPGTSVVESSGGLRFRPLGTAAQD